MGQSSEGRPATIIRGYRPAGCADAVDPASGGERLVSVTGHQKRLNGRIEASEGWIFNLRPSNS